MKEQVLNSPFCRTEFLDLAEIEIRPRKEYVGFISKTNFVDVKIQTKNLWVWINLKSGLHFYNPF